MSEELKGLVESFNKNLSEFKSSNDERLEKIEKNEGFGELESKVNKQVDSMLSIEKQISELKTITTEISESKKEQNEVSEEHVKAANQYLKSFNPHLIVEKSFQQRIEPDGGIAVHATIETGIYQRVFETSPMRQVASVKTIEGNEYHKTVRKTQLSSGGWVNELEQITTTDTGKYGTVKIGVNTHMAFPQISSEMFEDASFNMEQEIINEAGQVLDREQNTAFITGSGIGKPKGITSYSAWSGSSYQFGKVQQINSGNATDVTVEGLIDLQNALKEEYQSAAVFMMARATFGALIKKKGTDVYFFSPNLDRNVGAPFNLLGKPVIFASDMPSLGAGALAIAYGDFGRGYTVVDKTGIRIIKDEISVVNGIRYKVSKRTGGGVTDFDAIKIQKIAS